METNSSGLKKTIYSFKIPVIFAEENENLSFFSWNDKHLKHYIYRLIYQNLTLDAVELSWYMFFIMGISCSLRWTGVAISSIISAILLQMFAANTLKPNQNKQFLMLYSCFTVTSTSNICSLNSVFKLTC